MLNEKIKKYSSNHWYYTFTMVLKIVTLAKQHTTFYVINDTNIQYYTIYCLL